MASMSVRMEAPVVVKPEQDSKNASAADGIAPESQKGSAPMTEQSSQLTDTTRKPSRTFIFSREGLQNCLMINPKLRHTSKTIANALAELFSW